MSPPTDNQVRIICAMEQGTRHYHSLSPFNLYSLFPLSSDFEYYEISEVNGEVRLQDCDKLVNCLVNFSFSDIPEL